MSIASHLLLLPQFFDWDGNGKIFKQDLAESAAALHLSISHDDMDAMITLADEGGSGSVSMKEFLALFKDVRIGYAGEGAYARRSSRLWESFKGKIAMSVDGRVSRQVSRNLQTIPQLPQLSFARTSLRRPSLPEYEER